MTVLVAVSIVCDWCGSRTGPWHTVYYEPGQADAVAEAWLARDTPRPWHMIPSPPGQQFHLCPSCYDSGPPKRLPPPRPKGKRSTRDRQGRLAL